MAQEQVIIVSKKKKIIIIIYQDIYEFLLFARATEAVQVLNSGGLLVGKGVLVSGAAA